jgi:phage head maturation protease
MDFSLYCPLRKVDGEAREVWGYASTEARDAEGEIVRREALAAALPDYMRFANIREMHRPSAVGVAEAAAVDERGLHLRARIIDDDAWRKVKEGVYKGFSIGGRVTGRDPGDRRIITGLDLTEISLVDRPANPEAVFSIWKSSKERMTMGVLTPEAIKAARARLAQKWIASDGAAFQRADDAAQHEAGLVAHAGDAPAGTDFADPGFQPDGKKRYPLDTAAHIRAAWSYIHQDRNAALYAKDELAQIKARIVAAWKAKIDRDGPPAARGKADAAPGLRKGLQEVARLAALIGELEWLRATVAAEEAADGDPAGISEALEAAIAEICGVLHAMVDAATAALMAGDDDDAGAVAAKRAGAAMTKLMARNDALAAELGAALPLIREVKDLVAKVAAQPAVVPPSRLVAVDKGADVARELERLAAQPPAVTAFELIKRAMREPLPFGAPLDK